jgi:hypothetical protein
MQDEPGGGRRFSYKMSLEERSHMLGFDHQRAHIGRIEPGRDSGFVEGSGEVEFNGRNREEVYD